MPAAHFESGYGEGFQDGLSAGDQGMDGGAEDGWGGDGDWGGFDFGGFDF